MVAGGHAVAKPAGRSRGEWEQLDRAHVSGGYALGQRLACCRTLQVCCGRARIGLVAVGAWLVIGHELTPAALFACVLINALLLAPLERLAGSLPFVHGALSAHHRLADLARRSASRRAAPSASASVAPAPSVAPRLNITGPLALGLAAMLLFVAAASGAAVARLGDLAALAGARLFETGLTPVALPGAASPHACTCATAPRAGRRPPRHAR